MRPLALWLLLAAFCGLLTSGATAQVTTKAQLEYSETLFSVLAAINACGYDHELGASDAMRTQVRAELAELFQASSAAAVARDQVCAFYRDHRQPDPARDLAQYISLALNLGPPPEFAPTLKEADMPPDASYVLGLVPHLQRFHRDAALQRIFQRHAPDYERYVEQLRQPINQVLFDTDMYLRMPSSGFVGRRFVIYSDPMGAPGQVNARNYANDYFLVVSPSRTTQRLDEVRHTYLHFVLDPFALKRANTMKRLAPLLSAVSAAPLDPSFKSDVALLLTESLIRAIEARLVPGGKPAEPQRQRVANDSMREGYILAPYFFEALEKFEREPVGFKDAYPDLLFNLDLSRELKRAEGIRFSAQASPEVVRASNVGQGSALATAEERLAAGDVAGARALAQEALQSPSADHGRALFILARAATLNRDIHGARAYFEQTLSASREPRVLAWSHIYLGRIFDLQENREAAVRHYQAALAAGDATPDTRAAAERGLSRPYEPSSPQPQD